MDQSNRVISQSLDWQTHRNLFMHIWVFALLYLRGMEFVPFTTQIEYDSTAASIIIFIYSNIIKN